MSFPLHVRFQAQRPKEGVPKDTNESHPVVALLSRAPKGTVLRFGSPAKQAGRYRGTIVVDP